MKNPGPNLVALQIDLPGYTPGDILPVVVVPHEHLRVLVPAELHHLGDVPVRGFERGRYRGMALRFRGDDKAKSSGSFFQIVNVLEGFSKSIISATSWQQFGFPLGAFDGI